MSSVLVFAALLRPRLLWVQGAGRIGRPHKMPVDVTEPHDIDLARPYRRWPVLPWHGRFRGWFADQATFVRPPMAGCRGSGLAGGPKGQLWGSLNWGKGLTASFSVPARARPGADPATMFTYIPQVFQASDSVRSLYPDRAERSRQEKSRGLSRGAVALVDACGGGGKLILFGYSGQERPQSFFLLFPRKLRS